MRIRRILKLAAALQSTLADPEQAEVTPGRVTWTKPSEIRVSAPAAAPDVIKVPQAAVGRIPDYFRSGKKFKGLKPAQRHREFRKLRGDMYQRAPGGGVNIDFSRSGLSPENIAEIKKHLQSGKGPIGRPKGVTMPRVNFPRKPHRGVPTRRQYIREQKQRPAPPLMKPPTEQKPADLSLLSQPRAQRVAGRTMSLLSQPAQATKMGSPLMNRNETFVIKTALAAFSGQLEKTAVIDPGTGEIAHQAWTHTPPGFAIAMNPPLPPAARATRSQRSKRDRRALAAIPIFGGGSARSKPTVGAQRRRNLRRERRKRPSHTVVMGPPKSMPLEPKVTESLKSVFARQLTAAQKARAGAGKVLGGWRSAAEKGVAGVSGVLRSAITGQAPPFARQLAAARKKRRARRGALPKPAAFPKRMMPPTGMSLLGPSSAERIPRRTLGAVFSRQPESVQRKLMGGGVGSVAQRMARRGMLSGGSQPTTPPGTKSGVQRYVLF